VYWILFYDVVDDYLERRTPHRPAHFDHLEAAQARGELVMAGALAEPADGAVLVFRAPTPAPVEEFARTDPYVRAGVVTAWRVRQWTVVIGGEE